MSLKVRNNFAQLLMEPNSKQNKHIYIGQGVAHLYKSVWLRACERTTVWVSGQDGKQYLEGALAAVPAQCKLGVYLGPSW